MSPAAASEAIRIECRDGVIVCALGEQYVALHENDYEPLRIALNDAVNKSKSAKMVLDLSTTRFFGSGFIESLFQVWTRLKAHPSGGYLALAGLNENCREVIEVTHLDRLWSVFASREEAITAARDAAAPTSTP